MGTPVEVPRRTTQLTVTLTTSFFATPSSLEVSLIPGYCHYKDRATLSRSSMGVSHDFVNDRHDFCKINGL